MIIVMQQEASDDAIETVVAELTDRGFDVHRSTGSHQTVLGVVGEIDTLDPREFELYEGVQEVVRVSEPYKLAGRTFKKERSVIEVKGISIGGSEVVMMAGPCTIENETQVYETAKRVAKAGAKILRGGAFKPRTSPYSFQGMGIDGLKISKWVGNHACPSRQSQD
ncbi:MAG: hypothetical protein R3338_09065 [Thermoanaerobaculia bacterium]|nr:hypothetical protein [Thermoanaerobaculia bacterium]